MSWQETDGATVTNVQDYDRGLIHSFATLPGGQFLRMTGTFAVTRPSDRVLDDRPQRNKALVIEAMTSLFQRRDASAVERLYAPDYVQHNPKIPQGREALQALVAGLSQDVYYEPGLIVAEGDLVAIHGRIRGWADAPQVAIDLFRIEDGRLAEHWDVLQNEVPVTAALGGVSMFDPQEGATGLAFMAERGGSRNTVGSTARHMSGWCPIHVPSRPSSNCRPSKLSHERAPRSAGGCWRSRPNGSATGPGWRRPSL